VQVPHLGEFSAAVLFSDISGFTVLTGKLAGYGAAGAEELTVLLNRYFSRMIDLLEQAGGEVVQFSGDAMMVVFPCSSDRPGQLAQAVQQACLAGQQMQQAMKNEFALLDTSLGTTELGMKISIGVGQVREFFLGGVFAHWYYLIAGEPLTQVAEAEHRALKGQVVLSAEADAVLSHPADDWPAAPSISCIDANDDVLPFLRAYTPYVITHRLQAGQSEWLAEIRRLTVLFFNISGIDYASQQALTDMQRLVETLQQKIYHHGGTLNKILVDDKGTVGIGLFGAPPLSHQDDPLRATRCALELQTAVQAQGLNINLGLTTGLVFAGPVGSLTRREYTVMGDAVNLAARLMQSAARAGGGIRSDDDTRLAAPEIEWEALYPELMKGFSAPVALYRPIGFAQQTARREIHRRRASIIGREHELDQLALWVSQALQGRAQVVLIESEPGQGRSRLLTELIYHLRESHLSAFLDRGAALEQQTPYSAWREIFSAYLGIEGITNGDERRERVMTHLVQIDPALPARAPLLNSLLALDLPESDLTAHLEPRLRQASLETLLLDLIGYWLTERPLLLAIEEVQWLDSLSWQLVLQLARTFHGSALVIILTAQTFEDTPDTHPWKRLQALPHVHHLPLLPLCDEDIIRLAAAQLGVPTLPAEAARLIVARSAGNPFVAEELVATLRDQQIVRVIDGDCELVGYLSDVHIPDTLQGMVLNRIDQLPAEQQLTLKVAAVIGRSFGYRTLCDVYPLPMDVAGLQNTLQILEEKGLIYQMDSNQPLYSHSFGQAFFQEVTYRTILPSQSRELHQRVAQWYEAYARQAGESSGLYPLLAYHWRQASNDSYELLYATLAGQKLMADYANNEALGFLERALQLETDLPKRYALYELCLHVHERLGNRTAQREDLQQLQALADAGPADPTRYAHLSNAWADYYRSQAQYAEAQKALAVALRQAQIAGDQTNEARSLTLSGQVLEHQGEYRQAREHFAQALELYCQLGDSLGEADNLSRLSSIARNLGEKTSAREAELQALQLRRKMGHRTSEATSLINLALLSQDLGETDAAWNYRQQALALARAIGDRNAEALNLSTMGMGHLMSGDYAAAQRTLQQALRLHRAMGNRLREAECQNLLGLVWRDVGDIEQARCNFEQAVAIQEDIGNRSYATYTYLNLGYVLWEQDVIVARRHFETALVYACETGNREAEAYALSYIALSYELAGDWESAVHYYQAALPLRHELQTSAPAIEDKAGLARVALGQQNLALAQAHAETCWQHLQAHGVDGIEFPIRVYLTCYDVFVAAQQEAAAWQVIEAAYQLLLSRASRISDAGLRDSMLHHIRDNQRVLDVWKREALRAYVVRG
jgi:class 3 adenylate cyclase/predicted ATPase